MSRSLMFYKSCKDSTDSVTYLEILDGNTLRKIFAAAAKVYWQPESSSNTQFGLKVAWEKIIFNKNSSP